MAADRQIAGQRERDTDGNTQALRQFPFVKKQTNQQAKNKTGADGWGESD